MPVELIKDALPKHVGIIMDGNGRWAKKRLLPRTAGHKVGVDVARGIMTYADELGIKYLTLYTFSTENWKRSKDEVDFLMNLLKVHIKTEGDFTFTKHLDLARVDYCSFGNSNPFRIRIVNRSIDYFLR
jgi:undecaprenyl diphosphate synthase